MQKLFLWFVAACLVAAGSLGAMPVVAQSTPVPTTPAPVYATVNTNAGKRLHVRSGPGVKYPIIERLVSGQRVPALGRDAGAQWVLVSLAGEPSPSGWVSAAYVTLSAPMASLPVASTVSVPAPTTPAQVAPPSPTVAPASRIPASGAQRGKIAVPIFDPTTGAYNIWLVNADGSNLHLVVTDASAPALSDDGRQLAYRHWRADDRGIVVSSSEGANALRLTDKLEDTLPSFAPDGKRVVFSSSRDGDRRNRLYYAWTDEPNLRAWEWGAGGLFGEDPDWMADNRIVYRTTWPNDQLWAMNGDSSGQHAFFAGTSLFAPAASADSQEIAYMSAVDGNWDIYTVGIDGVNSRRLTDNPARDGLPVWSPDGRSIAFVSERGGAWGVWLMNTDGTNQRLLVALPGAIDGKVQYEPEYLNRGWIEEQIAWSW